jgi:hypothetical protein
MGSRSSSAGSFSRRYQSLALVFVAVMLVAASVVVLPRQRTAQAAGTSPVQLGYFYIPPTDGTTAATLAARASFITLTQGNESYRDSVRANGYSGDILQYIVSAEIGGPGPYKNASATCDTTFDPLRNQVSDQVGDFCKSVHPNENWFLHNGKGERLYSKSGRGVYYRMNPAASGWRQFALSRMKADLNALGYDGIFLDNVELSWNKSRSQLTNSDGVIKEFSSDGAFRNAWVGYLSQLSGGLRSSGKLWANMINDPNDGSNWGPYLQHLDGGMFETWAVGYRGLSPKRWDNNLRQAEAAQAMGKGILAVSPGPKSDNALQTFALSSYLLIADGGNTFFRYASDTNEHEYTSFWQYANYNVALGKPVGARYAVGTQWRRDFECGSVTVDPAAQTGTIAATTCSGSGSVPPTATPSPTNTPVPTNTPAPTNTPVPTNTPAPTNTPVPTNTPQPATGLTVTISGLPVNGDVQGTINVRAKVGAENRKGLRLRFYLDGVWQWSEGIAPFYLGGDTDGSPAGFDTRAWTNGTHTLSAVATLADGSEATTSVKISVRN